MTWLSRTGSLPIVICVLTAFTGHAFAAAGSLKNTDAARLEELYNGFPVETDTEGHEGFNAARKAAEQLRLDFLTAFRNPQRNAANQTAWDEEEAQLISDSLKYGGDRTLDAIAMYWGLTKLNLPVISPQELLAQAKAMPVADQGKESLMSTWPNT